MSAQPPKLTPEDRLRFFEKMAADTMSDCYDPQPMLEQLYNICHCRRSKRLAQMRPALLCASSSKCRKLDCVCDRHICFTPKNWQAKAHRSQTGMEYSSRLGLYSKKQRMAQLWSMAPQCICLVFCYLLKMSRADTEKDRKFAEKLICPEESVIEVQLLCDASASPSCGSRNGNKR